MNTVAIVQTASAEERALIECAGNAVKSSAWIVGRCAAQWCQQHARGRTDADFAKLIGDELTGKQIQQRRLVWDRFGETWNTGSKVGGLRFSHFRTAVGWTDAEECLAWADEFGANVAEMTAWRRAKHGDDLTESNATNDDDAAKPTKVAMPEESSRADRPIWKPTPRPKTTTQQTVETDDAKPTKSNPRKPAGKTEDATEVCRASIDALRRNVEKAANLPTIRRDLWKLIRAIDPEKADTVKPTVDALMAAIPAAAHPDFRKAAEVWAAYKMAMRQTAKRIQSLAQWDGILESMATYEPGRLLEAVTNARDNTWVGWKHGLSADDKRSARVRSHLAEEIEYHEPD